MRNTGVKCTEEERKELVSLAEAARRTPVIALSSKAALEGRDLSSQAWDLAKKRCHELALAHGLPEIQGYYGATPEGEFVEV